MKDIILTCCGAPVAPPPEEMDCPECGTHWTELQVEEVQMRELEAVPVVDSLRAARMLKQDKDWVVAHWEELGPMYCVAPDLPEIVFPVTDIRLFARDHNLRLTPLSIENDALWAQKNP